VARSTSFYFSFLALPPAKRRAIISVFDFCRSVDDSVDLASAVDEADRAIALWRREVERVFTGGSPTTPQGRALQNTAASFALARRDFDALVDGVEMDIRRATTRRLAISRRIAIASRRRSA
jgi:phytoene synthase